MNRWVLVIIGTLWAIAGLFAFALPMEFYTHTPGVVLFGPFNEHFVRDVGLAFIASGSLTASGAWRLDRSLSIAGTVWPCLHAFFHLHMWIHRNFPIDAVSAFDFSFVISPAFIAFALARKLPNQAISRNPENSP